MDIQFVCYCIDFAKFRLSEGFNGVLKELSETESSEGMRRRYIDIASDTSFSTSKVLPLSDTLINID